MIDKLKLFSLSLLAVGGVALYLLVPSVSAISVFDDACQGTNAQTELCQGKAEDAGAIVNPIVSTILFILGAVSVVVIIVGGIMYTVSAGDPGKTKKAKDTILYAVIGLVVALLAYSIVAFVVGRF